MEKPWGGRFKKSTHKLVENFTPSISFDKRLYRQDIEGSVAHAKMLAKTGIITEEEAELIIKGLDEIQEEIKTGKFEFKHELEDIHMNIEKRLIEKIGPVGGKLHTARSRNDQVTLDVHLYLKEEIDSVLELIVDLQKAIISLAEKNVETIMPGYTHLQRAQPISFAHHIMAYYYMLERDYGRLVDCYKRTDMMPLGAGALAGTSLPIDRKMTARLLGFSSIYENSIDAVSDRDFIMEFLSAAAILMTHLSRLGEELVLWSSAEFNFIEIDDGFATGSSIMPQKKNPDVAELVRGKSGRVFGNLMALLAVMKSLPLAYHSDMQEDKERLFDTVDTVKACLAVLSPMLITLKVNSENMRQAAEKGFTNATDVADYLVKKGVPFRKAHEIVGKMVLECIEKNKSLSELTIEEFKSLSPLIEEDIYNEISIKKCVESRNSCGGTSFENVRKNISRAKENIISKQKPLL
ncbi:MAG: argininosuccinate lyase [Thermosediminibacterales bacterium]|nr:argininosuccinate lyase [Thermosediminibacterales bacterium]